MSTWRPRPPAFAGDEGAAPSFRAAPREAAERLQLAVGKIRSVESAPPYGSGLGGFYRIETADEREPIFVKVLDAVHAQRQVQADRIARWVDSQGVSASVLLPGYPRPLPEIDGDGDGEMFVLAYPFVAGRFALRDELESGLVGGIVARLHLALRVAPFAPEIQSAGAAALSDLRSRAQQIRAGDSPHAAEVVDLFQARGGDLDFFEGPSQAVHGDLNRSNVLVTPSEEAVVIDFEEAPSAWMPTAVDVAFALERFCLVPDPRTAERLAGAFADSYRSVHGPLALPPGWLARARRALALRALVRLVDLCSSGSAVAESEWQKFLPVVASGTGPWPPDPSGRTDHSQLMRHLEEKLAA